MSRTSSAKTWITGAGACLLGILLAMRCSTAARPPAPPAAQPERTAYRPDPRRPTSTARSTPAPKLAARTDDALSPELELRLRAAMNIATVPAPLPPGQASPPSGPLSAEANAQRQAALVDWRANVQQHMDRCVRRPASLRQPVALTVFFAPPLDDAGYTPQRLSAALISVPARDLRRLWRDTDPDALQECVDRIRTMPLVVTPARNTAAQALPTAVESVLLDL